MTVLEKLHIIEKTKCIYNIHYCKAGVGFVFYYSEKVPEPERTIKLQVPILNKEIDTGRPLRWKEGLVVERYYPTFEEAVEAEYGKLVKFVQTSECHPEQYDAFDEQGKQVGYLRVDGGEFRVRFPDSLGEIIYIASPQGYGDFMDNEIDRFLEEAKLAILNKLTA